MRGPLMHHWFLRGLERAPDAPALQDGAVTYTYAQVHETVSRWAAALRPARRVAVVSRDRTTGRLGMLAGLYAGATVVPVNARWPARRRRLVLQAAMADALITDEDQAEPPAGLRVFGPRDQRAAAGSPRGHVAEDGADDAVAYLLFTSGSTGDPKGVPIRHSGVAAFLGAILDRYDVGVGDVFGQTFDISFDLAVFELYRAWAGGAAVRSLSALQVADPARCVAEWGITVWTSTPSLVTMLASRGHLSATSMPGLRYTVFCGEPLPVRTARAWMAAAPNSCVDNLYGPTEATVACTGFRLLPGEIPADLEDSASVPIGEPFPGVACLMLGRVRGELCLSGEQVFDGYSTASTDPFVEHDGRRWYRTGDLVERSPRHGYVHLGRTDDQVKVNGYRVELGEVEVALRRHLPDGTCAAVTAPDPAGLTVLGAFTSTPPGRLRTLRADLAAELPSYMVPTHFWHLPRLPLTPNGKIDRQRLRTLAVHLLS